MSPTIRPSGCAARSSCMIRKRGTVLMAENMSANLATFLLDSLVTAVAIFRYLQKYGWVSSFNRPLPSRQLPQPQLRANLHRNLADSLFGHGIAGVRHQDKSRGGIQHVLMFVPEERPGIVKLRKVRLQNSHTRNHPTRDKGVVGAIVSVADQLGL